MATRRIETLQTTPDEADVGEDRVLTPPCAVTFPATAS